MGQTGQLSDLYFASACTMGHSPQGSCLYGADRAAARWILLYEGFFGLQSVLSIFLKIVIFPKNHEILIHKSHFFAKARRLMLSKKRVIHRLIHRFLALAGPASPFPFSGRSFIMGKNRRSGNCSVTHIAGTSCLQSLTAGGASRPHAARGMLPPRGAEKLQLLVAGWNTNEK